MDSPDEMSFRIKVAGNVTQGADTQRLIYEWEHARVHAFECPADVAEQPPWSLPDAIYKPSP